MNPNRKTIFLVDDDMTNLVMGNNALSETYDVFTLNSAGKLLNLLKKRTPDLILLDVEMPEMSGYEAIEILKSNTETKEIPVIFLTAQNNTESELRGLSLGAIDYIIKPFSPPLLLKRMESHLLLFEQKRELLSFNANLQEMVEARTKTVVELKNAYLRTMAELVECRDYVTGGHIERTQYYLGILLEGMQTCETYREEIEEWDRGLITQSAQLHDIGKIAIKDSILQKPASLTREEFEEIKTHATIGEQIIDKMKKNTSERVFLEQARILAASHHEKWDGSGYPRGLKGSDIPLQGRLMAIADVYDALASNRPYRKAMSHEQVVDIIKSSSGEHFDPILVDVFLSVAHKFNEFARYVYEKYSDLESASKEVHSSWKL